MMAKSSVSAKFPALPSLCARGRHGRRRSSETLYQLPLFDFEQTYLSARDSTDDVDETLRWIQRKTGSLNNVEVVNDALSAASRHQTEENR